ncbi:hypothetical protein ASD21_16835 [Caulobacter sp. Root1455]|uniref:TonB family protein n=1 Tax=Caulobacter sp. Root1455 TaxID=1736465 RepID=UPI0007130092|nr:TonB family protein [Caulobacter sp. Root1455]KQY91953.1 hypothetical protein ASD21_16835 [Caulobacter sp. Root1455]
MILPLTLMLQAALATTETSTGQPALTLRDVGVHTGGQSFDLYYPERAQRLGVSGQAAARCQIAAEGLLRNCVALSAAPTDQGFDEAATKLLEHAKVDATTHGGEPSVGRTLTVTVRFKSRRSIYSVRLE